jgi:putative glutamine amidotransferase
MRGRVGVTFRKLDKIGPYEAALQQVGLEPVRITPDQPRGLEGLDGLVLTGGTDIDPGLYGQVKHDRADEPDHSRDRLERGLLEHALALDIPVLAICRGMQLFNVVHGGSLIQHFEGHMHRGGGEHEVQIQAGSRLGEILGPGVYQVNSRHHQAIDRVGARLRVVAVCGDIVEAIERPDRRFAVAVQWHPEDRTDTTGDRALFEAFAQAVEGRRSPA